MKQFLLLDCSDRCRSKRHAEELFCAIAKTADLDEQVTFLKTCFSHLYTKDNVGRTALHVAASYGRTKLVRWLIDEYERVSKLQTRTARQRLSFADWLNLRDAENSWTALHRAVFYGQIDCARLLLRNEATRVYTTDKEGFTAFDLANATLHSFINSTFSGKCARNTQGQSSDNSRSVSEGESDSELDDLRPRKSQKASKSLSKQPLGVEIRGDVLVWGTNKNRTLGCESDARANPEALDAFRRGHISVVQVCLTRFHSVFLSSDGAVYTCGHGRGGRLGHPTDESLVLPKRIQMTEASGSTSGKASMEVSYICASENHTVMIGRNGTAYVCGSNEFGQLGNVLSVSIDSPGQKVGAAKVPAQRSNEIAQSGAVVLGVQALRVANSSKSDSRFIGACTSRIHSVFWTSRTVFTCGLNQGQLGYAKTPQSASTTIGELRQVTLFDKPVRFAVCNELTSCLCTPEGDVYLFTRFTVRKLPLKLDGIVKLFVFSPTSGGKFINAILALCNDGELYFWHEAVSGGGAAFQRVRRASNQFLLRFRDCDVMAWSFADAPATSHQAFTFELLACTPFGSVLLATVSAPLSGADCSLQIGARVPNLQRATRVFCELLGQPSARSRNFSALQAPPSSVIRDRLVLIGSSEFSEQLATQFREMQMADDSYDLVLLLNRCGSSYRFFTHRYLVASRCNYISKLIANAEQHARDMNGALEVRIDAEVDPALFRLLLQYIVAADCPLFVPCYRVELQSTSFSQIGNGAISKKTETDYFTAIAKMNDEYNVARNGGHGSETKPRSSQQSKRQQSESNADDDVERIVAELDRATIKQETKKKVKTKTKSKAKLPNEKTERSKLQDDVLGHLRVLAGQFGLSEFTKKLSRICLNEIGEVELRNDDAENGGKDKPAFHEGSARLCFDRSRFVELCDVELSSNDHQLFLCHKCVLTARVDYFRHMFIAQSGWREAALSNDEVHVTKASAISLPFTAAVCEAVLAYVYTDELPTALRAGFYSFGQVEKITEQFDLLCGVLIAADHLLIDRFRQLVEYELCELLTLRNAAFTLQLATFYNATQLRTACLEFIRLNIVTFLEQKLLDELSDELMTAVTEHYRSMEPQVAGRALLSSSLDDYPTRNDLAQLVRDYPKQRDADLHTLAAAAPSQQTVTTPSQQTVAALPNVSFSKPSVSVSEGEQQPPASATEDLRVDSPTASRRSSESEPSEVGAPAELPDDRVNVSSSSGRSKRTIIALPIRIDPPTFDSSVDAQSLAYPNWSGKKWTSSISNPSGDVPLLPETVTTDRSQMVSLRDIMAQEKQRTDAGGSGTSVKPATKQKLSQKERKALAKMKTIEMEAEQNTVKSPPPVQNSSTNVWEARKSLQSSNSQNAAQCKVEPGLLKQREFPDLKRAQQQKTPSTSASARSDEQAVVSFKQLLNAELADAREVERLTVLTSARANLECVEIEERAIQQLTELYNVENTFDVRITVERVAWDVRGKVKPGWVAKKS